MIIHLAQINTPIYLSIEYILLGFFLLLDLFQFEFSTLTNSHVLRLNEKQSKDVDNKTVGRSVDARIYLWVWSELRPQSDPIEMFIVISINLIYLAKLCAKFEIGSTMP